MFLRSGSSTVSSRKRNLLYVYDPRIESHHLKSSTSGPTLPLRPMGGGMFNNIKGLGYGTRAGSSRERVVTRSIIRWGIRRLVTERHLEEAENLKNGATESWINSLGQSPVALATDDANDQHYEVPPEFSSNAWAHTLNTVAAIGSTARKRSPRPKPSRST